MMPPQRKYFPNLNGLRFIAVAMVMIHHTEQFRYILQMENYWESLEIIEVLGNLGVKLFFVLSGFLITYLLLEEECNTTKINVKNFYIRRILRIWPLYFLIIFLAFFILPHIAFFTIPGFEKNIIQENLLDKVFLYMIFLPNLAIIIYGLIPYVSQTWSIGTEEQYYLIWPLLLKYIKKHRLKLMISIVFIYSIISTILSSAPYKATYPSEILSKFWMNFSVDCMAIGGAFAVLLFGKNKLLDLLTNKFVVYLSLSLIIFFASIGASSVPLLQSQFYSILFAIIILYFSTSKHKSPLLGNIVIDYLGKISYGLYIFHPIAIVAALKIALLMNFEPSWFIYTLSFSMSIALSGLSYSYFEKFFLDKKDKFPPAKSS